MRVASSNPFKSITVTVIARPQTLSDRPLILETDT